MALKAVQAQSQKQTQTANAVLQNSLTLLHFSPKEATEAAVGEARRNPFLSLVPRGGGGGGGGASGEADRDLEAEESLTETLLRQIGLISLNSTDMTLARHLPHCIDERGYLADGVEEMCGYLDCRPDQLRAVVARVQTEIEPAGVFAWSLKDCFRLQLESLNRYDPLIATLLDRLDLVAKQDLPGICALCGVDEEDARDMLEDIRSLRPAPLTPPPTPEEVSANAPELVFDLSSGTPAVSLNPEAMPKMLTDDGLFDRLKTVELDEAALSYYRDCYRGAAAFVTAMQKRANTLLRIGQEIAQVQGKFLATGRPLDRAPLTMGGLADTLSLNKSTISRALNACRVATPHGVIPAAKFFVRPLNEDSGGRTREQALRRLTTLIRAEDKTAPYSDEQLAELMGRARFAISRRTVAKYRGLIGAPGKNGRRQKDRRSR